jgi:hypothetical protein
MDAAGFYPSKIDTHQLGGGFNGHFWFAHTRNDAALRSGNMLVTGTWTFTNAMSSWGQVLVHLPDHGADTRQATYTVDRGFRGPGGHPLQVPHAHPTDPTQRLDLPRGVPVRR